MWYVSHLAYIKYWFLMLLNHLPTTYGRLSTMYVAGNEGKVARSFLFIQMYSLLTLKGNIPLVSQRSEVCLCARRVHNIWQVVSESFVNFHLYYYSYDYNWATSKLFIIIITSHSSHHISFQPRKKKAHPSENVIGKKEVQGASDNNDLKISLNV